MAQRISVLQQKQNNRAGNNAENLYANGLEGKGRI